MQASPARAGRTREQLGRALRTALRTPRKRAVPPAPVVPPEESAKAASLRYVSDARPGITRRKNGKGFTYMTADGRTVRDEAVLARIRSLVIPPAWTSVWICPHANGHIQATGRDARGRKQYKYHPKWHSVRDETKYWRMVHFGNALPRIRDRVNADLAKRGLPREKILAVVVRLLETTYIRVGNEEYARTNGSFGLTTLLDDHVDIRGARVRFCFRGKSGKEHTVELSDKRIAQLVRRSRDLPGDELFQYIADDGTPCPIDSSDVNDYLREIGGEEFTAKDFRTWAGTLLAMCRLEASGIVAEDLTPKQALVQSVKAVAEQLGNTPAVCKKGYIHPLVLQAYEDRSLLDSWCDARKSARARKGLTREENALLTFLESQSNR